MVSSVVGAGRDIRIGFQCEKMWRPEAGGQEGTEVEDMGGLA